MALTNNVGVMKGGRFLSTKAAGGGMLADGGPRAGGRPAQLLGAASSPDVGAAADASAAAGGGIPWRLIVALAVTLAAWWFDLPWWGSLVLGAAVWFAWGLLL